MDSILGTSGGRYPVPAATKATADEQTLQDAREYLEGIARRFLPQVSKTTVVLGNDPAGEIIACAREDKADLIALATRGRGAMARLLLGTGVAPLFIVQPTKPPEASLISKTPPTSRLKTSIKDRSWRL